MSEEKKQLAPSSESAEVLEKVSGNSSLPQKNKKQVVRSYDQGQLPDEQDSGDIILKPTKTSAQLPQSIEVSEQLVQSSPIKANRSAIITRDNNEDKKLNYKKPYSQPRSQKDDDDNFSDISSATRKDHRWRNLLISLGVSGLCMLGGFYLSKQNKKVTIGAGIAGFGGAYYLLNRN